MQKKFQHKYSKLAVPINSRGRMNYEKTSKLRTAYQRDRDRIIHSTAFRRLKHKTQVFINTTDDHYRTRITHSLEVAQIARTLAKYFQINEDLCETLSLAHDLGHTPFGHAGEEALNDCMKNFGGFDHNIQTLRIVTTLENKYYEYQGLNLTLETLDGLIKHNGKIRNPNKIHNILGDNFFKNKINFKNQPSLEAQIASISDDIAYNSHDLEDGLKAKLFEIKDLRKIPLLSKIINKQTKYLLKENYELVSRQIIREIINEMVIDIIKTTNTNISNYNIKSLSDIYESNKQIVGFSREMIKFDKSIKSFLKKRMYNSKKVISKSIKCKSIIKKLFYKLNKNKEIITKTNSKQIKERNISDFIAGMTDRYAINLERKL